MKDIIKIIDQTNIKKEATAEDIKKTCQEAKEHGFRGVCINPEWVKLVREELNKTDIYPVKLFAKGEYLAKRGFNRVEVVVLIDPPMGLSSHQKRLKLCQQAKKDGATELDIVMNIVDLKYERYDKILNDLKPLCKILPSKVIIGSGYLNDEEIVKASQLVKKAGAVCVKTATFKDPLEHRELKEKFYHLKLMRKGAPGLLIKVAGEVRNLSDAQQAIKAGADIIGTSSGVKIIKEL